VSNDRVIELYRHHATEQSKYTYFLLAAAASGIAFAVRSTEGASPTWSLVPVGLAVAAWASSFHRGCRYLQASQLTVRVNMDYLLLLQGEHPLAGREGWKIAAGSEALTEQQEKLATSAAVHYVWQFRYLVAGGLFFLAWHVLAILGIGLAIA
jgi:hypothetical protein